MKKLLFLLLAAPLFTAVAGERYLIEPEEKFGEVEFEPEYFKKYSGVFRVVDKDGKCVPQMSLKDYARFRRIRFAVPQKEAKLYLEPGAFSGEKLSPDAGHLLNFNKLKWKGSIPQIKRTKDGFAVTAPTHASRPFIESDMVDLPEHDAARVIFAPYCLFLSV